MLQSLKVSLAVYAGIYLLLPGCLCQVFSAFGIETHIHKSPPPVHTLEAGIKYISCHCSDFCQKSAELQDIRTQTPTVPCTPCTTVSIPEQLVNFTKQPTFSTRGPPDISSLVSFRFTGSFLV